MDKKNKIKNSTIQKKILLLSICLSTIFMSIGYATINSISLNINGLAKSTKQEGIFITDYKYVNDVNADLENSKIDNIYQTNLKSSIVLSETDPNSSITYKITLYNSTNYDYIFNGVIYDEELVEDINDVYNNFDIIYEHNNQNEIITKNGGTLDVILTFKYSQFLESTSNILNSILNFEFYKICNITYNGISNIEGLPTYTIENNDFILDLSSLNYYYFSIFMGNEKLVLNEDYTFNNRILKIFNVKDDLIIGTFGAVTNGLITLANQYTNTSNIYGDFKILSPDTDLSNSLGSCTYDDCYSDNNGDFEYDGDDGLVFDSDNQIGILNIDDSMKIEDEFTVYITLKADANQVEPNGKYSTAVIAMSENGSPYLIWIGFYKGYLHVYSYKQENKKECNHNLVENGFLSINAKEYSNKIVNIQITANRTNKTNLYINGELIKTFNSGGTEINYSQATLGDLRPGRGLKFKGVIYDIALYNRELTEDEILTNWNYSKEIWKIS